MSSLMRLRPIAIRNAAIRVGRQPIYRIPQATGVNSRRAFTSAQPDADDSSDIDVGEQCHMKSSSKLIKEEDTHHEEEKRIRLSEVSTRSACLC